MKLFYQLFLCISLPSILLSQQWQSLEILPNGRYDDIYFHNAELGWAVNGNGSIHKTEDGGETWNLMYQDNSLYFRSVEFLDENLGFAGTLDSSFLKTENGGETWSDIKHLIPGTMPGICGLSYFEDNVYGVGFFNFPAYFIKSNDRGETWSFSDLSEFADGLVECHFIDANLGFVAGIKSNSGGVILKTIDGGETWSEVLNTNNGSEYIWKLDFVTDEIAYGSIESFTGGNASIVKSVDGSNTWLELEVTDSYLDLQGIGFINEDTGWVGPRNQPLYETNDGGLTWEKKDSLFSNINRFFRVSPALMYASGSIVHKYTDESVATKDISYQNNAHSLEISPNPFFDQINITLNIDKRTNLNLDLFTSHGQLVKNIASGKINEGIYQYSVTLDEIDDLGTRNLYIVLRTNERFISKQIIKAQSE